MAKDAQAPKPAEKGKGKAVDEAGKPKEPKKDKKDGKPMADEAAGRRGRRLPVASGGLLIDAV